MTYWRSTSQFEVDLIIGNELAIEIKGTELVQDKHLKGIRAFKEEHLVERYVVVSNDPQKRVTADGIHIYPWNNFLDKLWAGEII
jgi:predicted AAA+ superfamily ATPase